MENYNHFVVIAAGENPDELMKRYESGNEKTVVIYKEDAEKLRRQHIEMAKAYKEVDLNEFERLQIEDIIETLEEQTLEEFWNDFIAEQDVIDEDENGNITVLDDSSIKFSSYNIGKNLSAPFILKNGELSFQDKKGNVDWDRIHLFESERLYYERVWEIVMDGEEPKNDDEMKIKRTMGNRKDYFSFFGDKYTYAAHCSAFWGYAFLSEETGWVELNPERHQIEWVLSYYEDFIKPLPENTLLTIYECRK